MFPGYLHRVKEDRLWFIEEESPDLIFTEMLPLTNLLIFTIGVRD